MFRCLLLSAFLIITSLLGAQPATALAPGEVVMSLTPSEQDIELKAGATYHGSVEVSNIGSLPFKITVSASPYYVKNDNYEPDFDSESTYTQLYHWLRLPKRELFINPGQSLTVPFEVEVPKDAVGGGQYAAIMLRADGGSDADDANAMKLTSQLAAILRGHVSGAEVQLSGELLDHSLPQFMFNHELAASQTVKNTGNTDFKVTQTLTVCNFFTGHEVINPNSVDSDGRPIGTSVATILPGTSRTGILVWDGAPQLGLFRVEQTINFLDQSYLYSTVVFLCPLWLLFVVSVAILALIFYLITRFCRRNSVSSD